MDQKQRRTVCSTHLPTAMRMFAFCVSRRGNWSPVGNGLRWDGMGLSLAKFVGDRVEQSDVDVECIGVKCSGVEQSWARVCSESGAGIAGGVLVAGIRMCAHLLAARGLYNKRPSIYRCSSCRRHSPSHQPSAHRRWCLPSEATLPWGIWIGVWLWLRPWLWEP